MPEKRTETVETKDGHKIDVRNHNGKGDVFTEEVFEQLKDDFREMTVYEAKADLDIPVEEYKEKYGRFYKEEDSEKKLEEKTDGKVSCEVCGFEAEGVVKLAEHIVDEHPEVEF